MFKALTIAYAALPILAAMAYTSAAPEPVARTLVGSNVSRSVVEVEPATCCSSQYSGMVVDATDADAGMACCSASRGAMMVSAEAEAAGSCCNGGSCPMSEMASEPADEKVEAALTLASVTADSDLGDAAGMCDCGQCEDAVCTCASCAAGESKE